MAKKLLSGHEVVPLTTEENQSQRENFKAYVDGAVRLQPKGWFFTKTFLKFADKVYQFQFKASDVVVMTYPKCGTTWMQEIIWTMRNNPDLNSPNASLPINIKCPFIEFDFIVLNPALKPENPDKDPMMQMFQSKYPGIDPNEGLFLHLAKTLPEPRSMKTHLPFSLLSKDFLDTSKVVYVARNPKDVCMSFYHHSRLFKAHDYKGTFEQFFDYFLNDKLIYGPFWKHIEEAWQLKGHKNLHFTFFEDFKEDPKKEIQKLDQFIGTELSDQQINNVVQHTNFAAMKARDSIIPKGDHTENSIFNVDVVKNDGGFFRKGKAGTWQNQLTKKQEERMNNWIQENTKNMDIQFKYK